MNKIIKSKHRFLLVSFFAFSIMNVFLPNAYAASLEVNQEKSEIEHPKEILYAILGDTVPLMMMGGGILSCAMCQYDPDKLDNREICLYVFLSSSAVVSSLGTLPSHFYAHSATWKKVFYPTTKFIIGGLSVFWYYLGSGLMSLSEDPDDDDIGGRWIKGFIPIWGVVMGGIHVIEMIDQSRSIQKYNAGLAENSQKKQVFLTPAVWDDKVGMAVQMRF